MSMRGRIATAALFALAASGCVGSGNERVAAPDHIIVIVVDTLRADYLGAAGGPVSTPNMDRLVAEGTSASRASGSFHQTTMSMGALFSGAAPSLESGDRSRPLDWNGSTWCGLARFGTGEEGSECLPRSRKTLAEKMKEAGYATVGIVSNQLLFKPAGFDRGFDEWREVGNTEPRDPEIDFVAWAESGRESRNADAVLSAVVESIENVDARKLFLYVHFMDVHDWFTPFDPSRSIRHTKNYADAVAGLDRALGDLLEELDARGLMQNAAVVLLADHGESLGEVHPVKSMPTHMGNPSYETVLRVPFVVWPAKYGSSLDSPHRIWRSENVHSQLVGLAGANDGETGPLRDDEVFVTEKTFQTYVRGKWKLSRSRKGPMTLLFDLENDPHETVDVSAKHPELIEDFYARLDELSKDLAVTAPTKSGMSARDADRLRALGYLE